MKYLRQFNEELSPRTYSSAAWKLRSKFRKTGNKDFEKRANVLQSYSENIAWEEKIREFSKYGKVTITTQINKSGEEITGDFYIFLSYDTNMFEENVDEYIDNNYLDYCFSVGMIPVDEKTKEEFSQKLPEGDFGNGFFWLAWATVDFENDNGFKLTKVSCDSYDWSVSGKILFTRQLLGAIRRHLLLAFSDHTYASGYTTHENLYDVIENETLIAHGISSHFGIDMNEIYEQIKAYSANDIEATDKQNWPKG